MVTSTELSSTAPQMLAAYWSAMRRCAPIVAPLLPPAVEEASGGPGSLKPTPAPSRTMMRMVAPLAVEGRVTMASSKAMMDAENGLRTDIKNTTFDVM